ncbi:MAG TPA: gluconokinase [Leptolinea sp.]
MTQRQINEWFLGIDLGTGSCKSVVIDRQAHILGFGSGNYIASTTRNKWDEQDPDAILSGMVRATRSAIEQAGVSAIHCQGLSIGSSLHTLLALDSSDQPLTGVMTWADRRAESQAQAIQGTAIGNRLYKQTGCPPHGMYPLYKIKWLSEKQPDIFIKAIHFVSIKEYVISRLTGQYLVDYSVAAGSGFLNAQSLDWNEDSLEFAGITTSYLSKLCDPEDVILGLNLDFCKLLGINAATPLIMGASDAVNSSLGAGSVIPGRATLMIGTSGALRVIAPQPRIDSEGRNWCYAIDKQHWLVGGSINNGGIAISWFKDIARQLTSISPEGSDLSFEYLMSLAEQARVGSDGLLCLPFFTGERSPAWNQNARGVLFGLTLQHDARHISRALIEGVAFRLKSIYNVLKENGEDIQQIRTSGGFTKSRLWLQIVSSALNHDLVIPEWGETSSLGAALWVLLGDGVVFSIENLGDLIPIRESYQPVSKDVDTYNHLYDIYSGLYQALRPSFDQIAQWQRQNSSDEM